MLTSAELAAAGLTADGSAACFAALQGAGLCDVTGVVVLQVRVTAAPGDRRVTAA